ncbi:hypothetical protein SAFG77S_06716 [Streptomyces afghaniensis]
MRDTAGERGHGPAPGTALFLRTRPGRRGAGAGSGAVSRSRGSGPGQRVRCSVLGRAVGKPRFFGRESGRAAGDELREHSRVPWTGSRAVGSSLVCPSRPCAGFRFRRAAARAGDGSGRPGVPQTASRAAGPPPGCRSAVGAAPLPEPGQTSVSTADTGRGRTRSGCGPAFAPAGARAGEPSPTGPGARAVGLPGEGDGDRRTA